MFLDTADLRDSEIYLHLERTADEDKKKGYVPAYYFKIRRREDDAVVGQCDLRIGHNHNTKYGGNIGYEIYEPFRGNHYAAKACKLLFELARKHGMKEVVITCSPDNIASRKTCEYAGAEFEGIVDLPEWHELYKEGKRKTCRYIKRL
ncbi:MAG TPA: GNAT family N-acetyltransferase [Firmicutes bacterium]|nr:GNAT family N-acetyltransferase [Bacillota bacterium]